MDHLYPHLNRNHPKLYLDTSTDPNFQSDNPILFFNISPSAWKASISAPVPAQPQQFTYEPPFPIPAYPQQAINQVAERPVAPRDFLRQPPGPLPRPPPKSGPGSFHVSSGVINLQGTMDKRHPSSFQQLEKVIFLSSPPNYKHYLILWTAAWGRDLRNSECSKSESLQAFH